MSFSLFFSDYPSPQRKRRRIPETVRSAVSQPQLKKLPENDDTCVGLRVFAIKSHDGLPTGVICNVVEIFRSPDGVKHVRVDRRGSIVPKDILRLA